MNQVPLREVATFINGRAFKPDDWATTGLPIIRIQNLTGSSSVVNYYNNPVESKYLVNRGDILISWSASLGVYTWSGDLAILNQHIFKVIPKTGVDRQYFYYAASSVLEAMKAQVHGTTMQHITKEPFESTLLPLPPLPEQQRIAEILAKADRLRRLRRDALDLGESYLQSVFLEMFGNPVRNPMGWEQGTLGDVITSTKDGPHVSPDYVSEGIPFLSTRNIRPGEIIWEDLKLVSREEAEKHWQRRECKPERGDILYTKGGTTGLAKAVDFDREIAIWVHIAVLKLKKNQVVPIWLENMLNTEYCYRQSQELTFGIVNRDLGLNRMPRIKLYIPPLSLQRKFAEVAQKYARLRSQQREAARQAEHLFQTLLNKAFVGEL